MKHFFFDLRADDQSLLYDYRGNHFSNVQSVMEFTRETVRMLQHSLSHDWTGWSVDVRDADGKSILSIPVAAQRVGDLSTVVQH
jgi:hypothetical protein